MNKLAKKHRLSYNSINKIIPKNNSCDKCKYKSIQLLPSDSADIEHFVYCDLFQSGLLFDKKKKVYKKCWNCLNCLVLSESY